MQGKNPYEYNLPPGEDVHVPRTELLLDVEERLKSQHLVYLMGTRGAGKSSFLLDLARNLKQTPRTLVVTPDRTPGPTLAVTLDNLADAFAELIPGDALTIQRLRDHAAKEKLDRFFSTVRSACGAWTDAIYLLLDEVDAYGDTPYGKLFVNGLKNQVDFPAPPIINVLVAGNLGVSTLAAYGGSPFLSRAKRLVVRPFSASQIRELARPFSPALPEEVVEMVSVSSGGMPRIATYVLHHLWNQGGPPTVDIVSSILKKFGIDEREYIRSIRRPIFDGTGAKLARDLWSLVRRTSGGISRSTLLKMSESRKSEREPDHEEVWHMLAAAGLIKEVLPDSNPVVVEVIPSIVAMERDDDVRGAEEPETLLDRLTNDLKRILAQVHTFGTWLFVGEKEERRLVENPLSALLCVALIARGWDVTAGPVSAAGLADIKATWSDGKKALVEVKIWKHSGFQAIDQQARDYRTAGVEAMATVTFAEGRPESVASDYEQKCLAGLTPKAHTSDPDYAPLQTYWTARREGDDQTVVHFLLCLYRRGGPK